MSIEFDCSQCSTTLRVAASNAGKKCKCPSCGSLLSIPKASSSQASFRPASGAVAGGRPIPPATWKKGTESLAEGLDAKVEIACPKCSTTLLYAPELEGTRGLCKGCGHIFTLTCDPAESEIDSESFPFQCPKCEFLFEGKPEMEGRRGKCTECQSVFTIEKLKPKKQSVAPERKSTFVKRPSTAKSLPPTAIPAAIPAAIPTAIPVAIPQSPAGQNFQQPSNASAWDAIDLNQAAWSSPVAQPQSPAYSGNPYSVGNYSMSGSPGRRRSTSSSSDVESIASWHRKMSISVLGVIIMLPVYIGLIVGMFAVSNPQAGQVGPIHFVILGGLFIAALIMLVLGILLLISYIVLCTKLYDSGMAIVMILGYFIGGIVPFLPLVMLVVVASKASSILKSSGYTVGLLGVSSDQLR